MTGDGTTEHEAMAAGLGIDRMHPPAIVAFFHGLPRRVSGPLKADEGEPAVSRGDLTGDEPNGPKARITEEARAALTGIADAVERGVGRTKSVGFPVDPDADVVSPDWSTLPDAIATQAERITAGAVEIARRLSGLSSTAWGSDVTLLDDVRDAVLSITRPLRDLERLADEDSIRRPVADNDAADATAAGEPDEGGESAVHRAVRVSNEAVPETEEDIEAAREALEVANNAPTNPTASTPPDTAGQGRDL